MTGFMRVAVLFAAGALLACRTRPASAPAAEYIAAAKCAGCHPQIAQKYKLTGMGRSFYRPRAERMVEDFSGRNTVYNRASDRYYTMVARGGTWVERRHQIGFDGKATNVV